MGQRMNDQKLGSGLACNQGFAKEEGLELQVQKFYKYIKIGRREQITSATQTYHRRELRLWGVCCYGNFCNCWRK